MVKRHSARRMPRDPTPADAVIHRATNPRLGRRSSPAGGAVIANLIGRSAGVRPAPSCAAEGDLRFSLSATYGSRCETLLSLQPYSRLTAIGEGNSRFLKGRRYLVDVFDAAFLGARAFHTFHRRYSHTAGCR